MNNELALRFSFDLQDVYLTEEAMTFLKTYDRTFTPLLAVKCSFQVINVAESFDCLVIDRASTV